jgi:hypothetical protein
MLYSTVSTPFIYQPRKRPANRVPQRLKSISASPGLHRSPEWRVHETNVVTRIPGSFQRGIVCKVRTHLYLLAVLSRVSCDNDDLVVKFYTPASHILCLRSPIPYHVAFTGSAISLASLLTYMPSRTGAAPVRACSRVQLLRQTTVDVKCVCIPSSPPSLHGHLSRV